VTLEINYGLPHTLLQSRNELVLTTKNCFAAKSGLRDRVEVEAKFRTQDVTDWTAMEKPRRFPVECAWAVALSSTADVRDAIARALIRPLQLDIKPLRPKTVEEKYARLQIRVAQRFGEAGAELIEENER
jgi:hypothetical protein